MRPPDRRWQELLQSMRTISTSDEEDRLLDGLLSRPGVTTLAFVNAHTMNLVRHDPDFASVLDEVNCLLRDGSGLALLMGLMGRDAGLNLNGTDMIPKILARHGGRRIAIFGTREPYLEKGVRAICERNGISADRLLVADGFQSDAFYLDKVRTFSPDIILLGMGMPRQERLGEQLAGQIAHPCLIVSGGAIVDFYAGRFPRAPLWMRSIGMEWFFRLLCEPTRLFRRYVIGNLLFIIRALRFVLVGWVRQTTIAPLRSPVTEMPMHRGPVTEMPIHRTEETADAAPMHASRE